MKSPTAIEDHLLEGRDVVATLSDTPADGVEDPDKREKAGCVPSRERESVGRMV
jgi:hypothetical protein